MKIGELMKCYNISRETVHYYVREGLLLPMYKGTRNYDFSSKEIEYLGIIQRLKKMHFTIKEIKEIINLHRTFNWIEPYLLADYISILQKKRKSLVDQQKELESAVFAIDEEIQTAACQGEKHPEETGLPVSALPYLACPWCGRELDIENALFRHQSVWQGEMVCSCGYHAQIDRGIVITGNYETSDYDRPDLKRDVYRILSGDYIKGLQTCTNRVTEKIRQTDIREKVVLEANINGIFYLYKNYPDIDRCRLYVILDKYPEVLQMYKNLFESLHVDLDILYIADASMSPPLKEQCVDIWINMFSCNEWQLYHEDTCLQRLKKYLTQKALIVGAYSGFKMNAVSRMMIPKKYPDSSTRSYCIEYLRNDYGALAYAVQSEEMAALVETPDLYSFAFHRSGEVLYLYYIEACQIK